ncbi:MAG TPA: pyruvate kinase [Cyclobacteriaceae bacterium]|nr:pyruvate kinase [Cytophagales bacterium]HNP77646.1 pyruvate kinase [Cyclobacteriaceae bacterium]HQQ81775.1 pyruvate kinase [Cyclobacteriaceae bacterium]
MARRSALRELTPDRVSQQLQSIIQKMLLTEKKYASVLADIHPHFKTSGINLLHYLVLRSTELRDIQEYLHREGLSSLTNSEGHTLHQLQKVLHWLNRSFSPEAPAVCTSEEGNRLRSLHSEHLLGTFPAHDRPHIMVTFSAELMQDRKLVEDMLNEGMTVARINCAHDAPDVWLNMIRVLRSAVAKTGKNCKIYMDLAGPKIRIRAIQNKKRELVEQLEVEEGTELLLNYSEEDKVAGGKKKKRKLNTLYVEPREILTIVKPGEHIFFDDGKFEARVDAWEDGKVRVEIVRISTKKPFLKPQKGINLPDSDVTIPPLTDDDLANIPFICEHADMVGYSFVNSPSDVDKLRAELKRFSVQREPDIILKIERLSAVRNLPALLMNGMQNPGLGVMIARGDLAVEIGFERLSEIQEEILWICEAAHVPVIWATQVLETLNKTGYATRSEITDAAMSVRAECVMLNKGQFIVKTIKTLDDILTRQLGHVDKKRFIMRPLGIAKGFTGMDRESAKAI